MTEGQHPHDGVDPGQVAAAGAQLFPDVGHRVDADDVHALVGQEQEIVHHLIEHPGIAVVQVPLVGIEGGHDVPAVVQAGEVAGCGGGEHLGHRLFVFGGDFGVVEEEVPAHVLPVPGQGPPGPLVVTAGVVHDKVHADIHALVVAGGGQLLQVLHGAQVRPDGAEIRHRVAAVVPALDGVQEGHQVDAVDPCLLQIVQLAAHPVQIAGEVVDVEHHAQQIAVFVPLRLGFPGGIPFLEGGRAHLGETVHLVAQLGKHGPVVIQFHVQPAQLVVVAGEAGSKEGVFLFGHSVSILSIMICRAG